MSLQNKYSGRRDTAVNNPGQLDRRITLYSAANTQLGSGEVLTSWVSTATVWASKRSLSGNRMMVEEGKHSISMTVFRVRHRTDVIPLQRVTHGDDVFEIVNTTELGRAHRLDLECRAFDQSVGSGGTSGTSPAFASFTDYTNASGNTTPAASAYNTTARITFSGTASTRIMILPAGPIAGALMNLSLIFPATAGIDVRVRSLTSGGTLLYELTSDGSGDKASMEFVWTGIAWIPFKAVFPA